MFPEFCMSTQYRERYPGVGFGLTLISGCQNHENPPGFDQYKRKLLRKMRKRETLAEITCKGFGMTAVVDAQERVLGIFTDGDLRRAFAQNSDVLAKRVSDFMTRDCKTVTDSILAAEALKIMQDSRINALLVVDGGERLAGVLNMHDLLRSRVM